MNLADDEFDTLPNVFEGVDWDSIPAMSQQPLIRHSTVAFGRTTPPDRSQISSASTAINTPASEDHGFEKVDESFLGEIDAIERDLTRTAASSVAGPSRRNSATVPLRTAPVTSLAINHIPAHPSSSFSQCADKKRPKESAEPSSPQKKARLDTFQQESSQAPVRSPSRKSKGKRRERDIHEGVKKVLEGFEDDLSCPICCDIFACAHLGNPCGHSFCGECGYDWIQKNKRNPTCAICRATLFGSAPMIPNYAMDNTIEKHVHALAQSNVEEWKQTGFKFKEWSERKAKWKAGAAQRAEAKAMSVDLTESAEDNSSEDESDGHSSSSLAEEAEEQAAAPAVFTLQQRDGNGGGGGGGRGRPRGGRRRRRNGINGSGNGAANGNRWQNRRGRGRGRA